MIRQKYFILVSIVLIGFCSGCHSGDIQVTNPDKLPAVAPFKLSSPAFNNGDTMPMIYTCDSTNISPALHWNNPFSNTLSFALIMEDPDASIGTWVHWIVYNIPITDTNLFMHFPMDSTLTNGIKQGYTSFHTTGYGGPCPPDVMHHYYFKLYALDSKLNVPARLSKTQLLNAMKGHILAEADLIGKYVRRKKNQ